MYSESAIRNAFVAMVDAVDAPRFSMAAVSRKLEQPVPSASPRWLRPAIAAAAALAIVAALPAVAPGVVQSIEEKLEAITHWTPPLVPPPASLRSQMKAQRATLAQAQARVDFTLVSPAGVPHDATSSGIATAPTGIYTKATQSWQLGPPCVYFNYARSRGRSFTLLAHAYDPRAGMPPKYMFDADRLAPDGTPLKTRHFAWRNGTQVTEATVDGGIAASEILAIQDAMRGTPLPLAETRSQNNSGSIDVLYTVP